MMEVKPHWSPDADYSSCPFFIRRMDTVGYYKPAEAPVAKLTLVGFIYVSSGEVLVDVDGTPFLCQPGQILLIPQQHPFAIRYYRDAIGYTGGFAPSAVADSKSLRNSGYELQWNHSRGSRVPEYRHLPSGGHQDGILPWETELVDMAGYRAWILGPIPVQG